MHYGITNLKYPLIPDYRAIFKTVTTGYEKNPSNYMFNGLLFHFGLKIVGLPRFELGQTEPKPVVLPLHHSPIIMCFPWKAVQRYVFPAI